MNSDMSQQIIDSAAEDGGTTGQEDEEDDDDEIPSYGFPSQPHRSRKASARNRCETTDIDQLINDGGKRLLLYSVHEAVALVGWYRDSGGL